MLLILYPVLTYIVYHCVLKSDVSESDVKEKTSVIILFRDSHTPHSDLPS